jgi:hypothetical protein
MTSSEDHMLLAERAAKPPARTYARWPPVSERVCPFLLATSAVQVSAVGTADLLPYLHCECQLDRVDRRRGGRGNLRFVGFWAAWLSARTSARREALERQRLSFEVLGHSPEPAYTVAPTEAEAPPARRPKHPRAKCRRQSTVFPRAMQCTISFLSTTMHLG